jgi:hypothetical protein
MGDFISSAIVWISGCLGLGLLAFSQYAAFKAAKLRKPGVGFFWAFHNSGNIFNWRRVYTPEGVQWAIVSVRCALGFAATFLGLALYQFFTGRLP